MNYKIQQGDVIFFAGEEIPTDGKLKIDGVVRHGESGNAHVIISGDCELITKNGIEYFNAKTETHITHAGPHAPHHGTVILPAKSKGRIGSVVEYNPYTEQIERVRD